MTVQNMTEPNGIEPLQVFMHTFEFLLQCTKLQVTEFQVMQWKLLRVLHLYGVPEGGWTGGKGLGGEGSS